MEGRLLGENGVWGPIFMISATNATLGFSRPSVAPMLDGGFAVAFVDGGEVFLRLLHSDGSPVGPPVMANTHTLGTQNDPAVAVLDNGNVAVAWASRNQAGAESAGDIYLKVFDPQGASAPPSRLLTAVVRKGVRKGVRGVDLLAKCLPVFAGRIYIGVALTAERGPVNGALSANQMRPAWWRSTAEPLPCFGPRLATMVLMSLVRHGWASVLACDDKRVHLLPPPPRPSPNALSFVFNSIFCIEPTSHFFLNIFQGV